MPEDSLSAALSDTLDCPPSTFPIPTARLSHLAAQHELYVPVTATSLWSCVRTVLYYVVSPHGSRGCAALAVAHRLFSSLSHVCLLQILDASGPFFKALADDLFAMVPPPSPFLHGWRCNVLDATCVRSNNPKADRDFERVHLLWELSSQNLLFAHCPLTARVGESLRHYPLRPTTLYIADRLYCTAAFFLRAHDHHAALLTRWNRCQKLWADTPQLEPFDINAILKTLAVGEQWEGWVRIGRWKNRPNRRHLRVRLVISHVGDEFAAAALAKLEANHQTVNDAARAVAPYLIVLSNAPTCFTGTELLELYRMRWVGTETQIREQKSVLGMRGLIGKSAKKRRAWLWAHLCAQLWWQLVDAEAAAPDATAPDATAPDAAAPDAAAPGHAAPDAADPGLANPASAGAAAAPGAVASSETPSARVWVGQAYRFYLKALGRQMLLQALLPIDISQWHQLRRRFLDALPKSGRCKARPRAWDAFLKKIDLTFQPISWRNEGISSA